MDVTLASATDGAVVSADGDTLTCPAFHITDSSEGSDPGCNVQILSVGDIVPGSITLSVRASTDGADLSKFAVDQIPISGWATDDGYRTLTTSDQVIGQPSNTTFSNTNMEVRWGWGAPYGPGSLELSDMGKTVVIVYTIDTTE